jgi:hypothetical protein
MEWSKQHWKEIVIVILVLLGLNKCTQSCTRQDKINESELNIVMRDSTINALNDSIYVLNTKLKVYEEKVAGLNQSLQIQDEATKRISEAKKNIQVSVKNIKK